MDDEILENHQNYLERKKLYTGFGYDIDRERSFILERAKPLYGKILEAGTGKGYFAVALAKQGYSFACFDISEEELHFAKLNLAYFGLEKCADFRIENAEHTSFADGSFDTIFSVNTLHHLRNPYMVTDELTRILSQKGKLILSDFTEEGFKIMSKIHSLEGKTHEAGKTTLLDIESYLAKKGFSLKKAKSLHQSILIAEKGLTKSL
ncbi:MAG: class I SAM-dependent methyltransferase [Phycisphaerae bacterium]|nr:class I SAM-dependent methyltransferase [Phycisphaerae bacterium]